MAAVVEPASIWLAQQSQRRASDDRGLRSNAGDGGGYLINTPGSGDYRVAAEHLARCGICAEEYRRLAMLPSLLRAMPRTTLGTQRRGER